MQLVLLTALCMRLVAGCMCGGPGLPNGTAAGPSSRSCLLTCQLSMPPRVPPRFRPSPEWLKMMKSVESELEAAVQQGTALIEGAGQAGEAAPQLQLAAPVASAGDAERQPGTAAGIGAAEVTAPADEEMSSAAAAGDGQ